MRKAFLIFYKDLRQYYSKAPVISWGILFPLAVIVLIAMSMKVYGESRMIPAMFTISLLFASTSMAQVSISFEKMSGSFNRLLYLPISTGELLLGKALGGFMYGFIGSGISALAIYIITGNILVIKPLFLLLGVIIGSLIFTCISIVITLLLDPIPGVALLNIVRFSMMFLGGVIFPSALIPLPIRNIVYIFPSVYVNEMIRYGLYNEWDYVDPYTSLVMSLIIVITLIIASYRLIHYILYR